MAINVCPCPDLKFFRFCKTDTVEDEICFDVPVSENDIDSISVTVPANALTVEFVTCDLIVVCGYIRKVITFKPITVDGVTTTPNPITKDIPVQINIPVKINQDTTGYIWSVTGTVCNHCEKLVCPCPSGQFTKLIEKDILRVVVSRVV